MTLLFSRIFAAMIVTTTATLSLAGENITFKDLVPRLTDLKRLATPVVEGEKTSFLSTRECNATSHRPSEDVVWLSRAYDSVGHMDRYFAKNLNFVVVLYCLSGLRIVEGNFD